MTIDSSLLRTFATLAVISLLSSPLCAQHRRRVPAPSRPAQAEQPGPKQPAIDFDTLLAVDSYKIYGEVRQAGQLVRSGGFADLLAPAMKLVEPPKEFRSALKWLDAHADALMTSRILCAAWPVRPMLPQVLVAIEFPNVEEAQKFEQQLRQFLPKLRPSPPQNSQRWDGSKKDPQARRQTDKIEPAPPPFLIKQSGSLIVMSESAFTFSNLRPPGSRLLAEDQNFRLAHDRFASESIFLYFNVALEDKSIPKPPKPAEVTIRSEGDEAAEQARIAENTNAELAVSAEPTEVPQPAPTPTQSSDITDGSSQTAPSQYQSEIRGGGGGDRGDGVIVGEGRSVEKSQGPESSDISLSLLSSAFFGGSPRWPEAVAAAIAVDLNSYVVRTLLINNHATKSNPIPFMPQLISGPALVLDSPSVLPADTEFFAAVSLDLPQIYDGMTKALSNAGTVAQRPTRSASRGDEPEPSPFAAYEKKLGFRIKEELLPVLGNEIAISLPIGTLNVAPALTSAPASDAPFAKEPGQKASPVSVSAPVVLMAVKDRKAVESLLPGIIAALGFKGANLIEQREKRDDVELVSYAKAFSYAFVGNFLVLSSNASATRHVVDLYLDHQTLSSDLHFRNYTRWQPLQVVGQIYISPALMERYSSSAQDVASPIRELISGLTPMSEPVTYAVSNEGAGPLHELHVPRNLVLMMIARIFSGVSESSVLANEAIARSALKTIASAEATYQATKGDGSYTTLEELVSGGLVQKELLQNYRGYKIELTLSGNRFEVSAVPVEYGKTGRLSYFLDESAVLRGGDHSGGPATIADKPVQ